MGSIAVGERNKMMDAYVGTTTYTANAAVYVKLHIGDPGGAGTSNAAAETTRKVAAFAAASAGAVSNTGDIQWDNVSTTEIYSHISLWTASSGGTFLGSDDLNATASMTAGDDFVLPAGDLDLSVA